MTDTNTEQTEHTAEQILERLEAEGHDYHRQIRILVDALALELHRLSDDRERVVACDELVAMLRAAAGAPAHWPAPSRSAYDTAAKAARVGSIEAGAAGVTTSYCPRTNIPFVLATNESGMVVRWSAGRPRTEDEQREAERLATRTVFREQGLRTVKSDDPIH